MPDKAHREMIGNDDDRIPVLTITGFLGAGKTTFLNRVLDAEIVSGQKIAVIVNEFGTLGVDGRLIHDGDYEMFELNRGSVFCTCIRTDFLKTLSRICEDIRPAKVIIEASGVAQPGDFDFLMEEERMGDRFVMAGNICMVDAFNFLKLAAAMETPRRQLAAADAIVINKADLVSDGELAILREVVASINPDAPIEAVSFARVSKEFLRDVKVVRHNGAAWHEKDCRLVSVSIISDAKVDEESFMLLLNALERRLLRLKGNIDFGVGPRFVDYSAGHLSKAAPAEGFAKKTAFCAIAWRMSSDDLNARLRSLFKK